MDRAIELALVERLRRGERTAFDEVYSAFRARLFSFLLRLTGRRDVAEDLSQETWLRLADRAADLREDSVLSAWLFTVARNLAASYWRSRWLDGPLATDLEDLDLPDDPAATPERLAEASDDRRALEASLAALAATDREVLLLIGAEGLSPAEAAALCGLKPGTLRKRLERARSRLAEALGRLATGPTAHEVNHA
jgi:RNA polymerase sigma-70 factor (ECF subfamily)